MHNYRSKKYLQMSILPHTVIQAIQEAELIQKHDRLCDLAAIDAIPIELLQLLTLNNQISIAKQSTTAERILINLVTNKNKEVRLSVFKNSNSTMTVLKILSEDEDLQIRRLFKVHPNNPNRRSRPSPKWLQKLAQNQYWLIRAQTARNTATPVDALAILANDNDYRVRIGVAENPATPTDILAILAEDPYHDDTCNYDIYKVRKAVAGNPATPPDILRKLSKDSSYFYMLRYNLSTPADMLEEFVEKNNIHAMRGMASNPSTPGHILARIAYLYPNEYVFLVHSQPDYYTGRIGPIPNFIGHKYLFQDVIALCRNSTTPSDILEKLADHKEYDRVGIANNQNTPIAVIEKLSHIRGRIGKTAQSRLRSIYRELAANPETYTNQLWEILYHLDIEIRLAVMLHSQGLNLLLERALQVENSLNRFVAGLHPQLSAVQRDKLFYSDNWLDRLAISCNLSTSIEYLQRLSKDTHDLIRDIATSAVR
jgi:hypothetical protein